MKKALWFVGICFVLMTLPVLGECPSADLTGDCFVDLCDFTLLASQWLTNATPVPDIVWVYINDPGVSGHEGFIGEMSKNETTNAQYCQFLNAALISGDVLVEGNYVIGANGSNRGGDFIGQVYYDLSGLGQTKDGATNGGAARINYSGGVFTVDSGFEDHPVTYVSWYGSSAFCNYYGWRLPTEWEWQAVADYDGSYIYGCGVTINHNKANYYGTNHPYGTTVVGSFGSYGYGMAEMAGNVWEWTSSINGSKRAVRGGAWDYGADPACQVSSLDSRDLDFNYHKGGFRACRSLVECPSEDLTGDCRVDIDDFEVLVDQWLMGVRLPQEMVIIPAGTFQMGDSFHEGDSDELPIHSVTLDSFAMGKYEITNGQYKDFMNSALSQGLIVVTSGVVYKSESGTSYPYCDTSASSSYSQIAFLNNTFSVRTKAGRDMSNDPMVMVSWYGAVAYCHWRSQQEGKQPCHNLATWTCDFTKNGYRLPTEAEWEYAARGGLSGTRFPWGNNITQSYANYNSYWEKGLPYYFYDLNPTEGYPAVWNDGFNPYNSPVGSFPANGYGLYDMAGNAWEWCHDWHGSYSSNSQTNPTGSTTGSVRVLRGGGWYSRAFHCRVANRGTHGIPSNRNNYNGFRVVLGLD